MAKGLRGSGITNRAIDTTYNIPKYLVYITNPVWAAVYRYAGEVFSRNPLHSVVQSAVDGKRQRLETFQNKLVDARRRGFHFEQVRSRYVARRYLAFL